MVIDRTTLHHHCAIRITRPSRCTSNRLGGTSSSALDRLLLRHLQPYLVDHA